MSKKQRKNGQRKGASGPKRSTVANFGVRQSEVMRAMREEAKKLSVSAGITGNIDKIFDQARKLALEARQSDPHIGKIYWFPHDEEVRLIELDEMTVDSLCGCVEPFYFDATADIPVPSGIAVIRPDQFGKLELPEGWGDWSDGREVEVGESDELARCVSCSGVE